MAAWPAQAAGLLLAQAAGRGSWRSSDGSPSLCAPRAGREVPPGKGGSAGEGRSRRNSKGRGADNGGPERIRASRREGPAGEKRRPASAQGRCRERPEGGDNVCFFVLPLFLFNCSLVPKSSIS
jgi:hypothetical protein